MLHKVEKYIREKMREGITEWQAMCEAMHDGKITDEEWKSWLDTWVGKGGAPEEEET